MMESEKDIDFCYIQFSHLFYFVKIKDSSEYLVDYVAFAKDKSKGRVYPYCHGQGRSAGRGQGDSDTLRIAALAGEEILDA